MKKIADLYLMFGIDLHQSFGGYNAFPISREPSITDREHYLEEISNPREKLRFGTGSTYKSALLMDNVEGLSHCIASEQYTNFITKGSEAGFSLATEAWLKPVSLPRRETIMELRRLNRLSLINAEVEEALIVHEKSQEIVRAFQLFDLLLEELTEVGDHVKKASIEWDEQDREFVIVMYVNVPLMKGVELQEQIDQIFYPQIEKKLHFCISTVTRVLSAEECRVDG